MKRRIYLSLLAFLLTAPALAQESAPDKEKAQDYSREKLLLIFNARDEEEPPSDDPDMTFEYSTRNWNIRWMPFLSDLIVNNNSGRAALMPVPDPFTLLGMSFPETADTYPDRGPQGRYRRRMVSLVHQANKADKALRLRTP